MVCEIHPTAIVHESAKLSDGVKIGPYSVIGAEVELGEGTQVGPHVVVGERTKIGKYNQLFQFSSVGEAPQDLSYKGEPTSLEMGDYNIVRESATLHRGTLKDQGITRIGHHNLFMNCSHVAHDCVIADHVILSGYAGLAGHVKVDSHVIIGAYSAIHQFCHVGAYAFITRAALVSVDILPYLFVAGPYPRAFGLNKIGLARHGFSPETIRTLWKAYKILYGENSASFNENLEVLKKMAQESQEVMTWVHFIETSQKGRGILLPSKKGQGQADDEAQESGN